jgi:hypothetical protein
MCRTGTRPLTVAREARRGQDVQRRPLGPTSEHRLCHADPAVERLERPDVQVLTGVARGHHRELIGRQVELGDAAGPQQRDQAERLDRRAQVDQAVRVAHEVEHPPGRIHLNDVAALDRLHDAVAHLARQHGRDRPAGGARGRCGAGGSARGRDSHDGEHSATEAAGATAE